MEPVYNYLDIKPFRFVPETYMAYHCDWTIVAFKNTAETKACNHEERCCEVLRRKT